MQSESLDDLLAKAALRQAEIQRLKKPTKEEVSQKSFPPPPTNNELNASGSTSRAKENVSHVSSAKLEHNKSGSQAVSEPDTRPPEHIKKVFASLADAYRSVDEEDSHPEPSSNPTARAAPLRSSTASSKSRSPLKSTRAPESPNNREKRGLETSLTVSPRPAAKARKPEVVSVVVTEARHVAGQVEPTELSLQERKALFEKPVPVNGGAETLSVQAKKALFEKPSPKKTGGFPASPKKQHGDAHTVRKVLFQEAAIKAQEPPPPTKPERSYKTADFVMKSPMKSPEKPIRLQSLAEFQEQPKEVGAFTRTLQDKLLVQTQAWKNNDVSRKIEEQKEEDMKVLKKRWELMAEEERRAAGRQHEIEELLEKRKQATYSLPDRPPPLPLPGSSILHETALKTSTLFPPPPPPHLLVSPVFDAIARFENPLLKNQRTTSPPIPPPPPSFPGVNTAPVIMSNRDLMMDQAKASPIQRRVKLPEEEGVPSNSDHSDDHPAYDERRMMNQTFSQQHTTVTRQKRSVNPKSPSGGRVVSWSSDNSDDEEDDRTRSPLQKRSSSSNLKPAEEELERSYTYEHNEADDQSEVSSQDAASGSSSVTQPISLSFYRKSQKESESGGVKRVIVFEDRRREVTTEDDGRRWHLVTSYQQRIDALHEVSRQQQAILIQTTSALNLCRTAPEFQGSIERAECERLLLLAAKKRDACHFEINRLKSAMVQLRQGSPIPDQGCHGTLTISSIQLSTKDGFVDFVLSEVEYMHYFVMLIKQREKVHATQMVNSVQHLQKDGTFLLPNAVTFDDLENDFVINIEIYAVQARRETVSHEEKYHIKDSGKKKGKKDTLKNLLPSLKEGSASHMTMGTPSKQEIRTTSFGCVGSCLISLQNVHEDHFRLSKVPEHCALEETLRLKITCGVSLETTEEGFLTIFEDCCGPSTWHRLWCELKNDSIYMWKYPEDKETHKAKVLSLRTCRGDTESTSLSVCARPHTFQMTLSRALRLSGMEPKESGPYRYFLSADAKEDRFVWQEKLNKVLSHIRAWIPNENTSRR